MKMHYLINLSKRPTIHPKTPSTPLPSHYLLFQSKPNANISTSHNLKQTNAPKFEPLDRSRPSCATKIKSLDRSRSNIESLGRSRSSCATKIGSLGASRRSSSATKIESLGRSRSSASKSSLNSLEPHVSFLSSQNINHSPLQSFKCDPRGTHLQRPKCDARGADLEQNEDGYGGGMHKGEAFDAILVLAGGQVDGGCPIWVQRRLDKALDLQKSNEFLCSIVCLGGGTPHKPPVLSPYGFVVHESSSCAEYLLQKGASSAYLIKEWSSYDTIGNGFFSLVQHAIPRRWQRLAVITSEFHMPRTRLVFQWVYGLKGANIQLQYSKRKDLGERFALSFYSVPDDCIDQKILQDRIAREQKSLQNVNILAQNIHTLEELHEWVHTAHKAYNTRHQHLFGKQLESDPSLLSY